MNLNIRVPTSMTDLERMLQASIARRQRQTELRDEAATAPRPKAASADTFWIAPGGSATVHGLATGDLVYVGKRVPSFDGEGWEPSAIDPFQPVDLAHPDVAGKAMPYWPAYNSIPSECRAAYLQWLHGKRQDPNISIGYVFVFFYGLERRVYEFHARRSSSADEVLAIAREVSRLLSIYAVRSSSFAGYGASLLDLIGTLEPRARALESHIPIRHGSGVPLRVATALGELAVAQKPIPAKLAYDWLRATRFLNTPATRCEHEFELLFHIRYANQFGEGIYLKPTKTSLRLTYHPASDALDALEIQRNVPDVTAAPLLQKVVELAYACSNALDAYSRLIGKSPNARESLAAFASLPEELVEGTHSSDARALAALVLSRLDEHGRAQLGAGELLQYVRISNPDKVSKNEAILLAQALEKLGYGIEPDVRLGGPTFEIEEPVVVFRRLPDCPSSASDEYATAMICMRLGTMVSAADDDVSAAERALLERHIAEALQLSPGEQQRLGAHLAWLVETNPGTTGLKKRLAALSREARHHIGQLLVNVATTDARVDPREMKILEKLYVLLGLDSADLYRDVHAVHASDEPVVVVDTPATPSRGRAIPPRPSPTAAGLDMSRVRLKIAETREVSALLGSIFVEQETAAAPVVAAGTGTIGTLDAPHSELLRRLAERESWPREDVERMASELALLPDGALETINDYAYAAADEPLWEDGDPLAINRHVAMELIR